MTIRIGSPADLAARIADLEEQMGVRPAGQLEIDSASQSPSFTGSAVEWEHNGRNDPNDILTYPRTIKGVLVIIVQNGTAEDQIESVEFAKGKLKEVPGSPIVLNQTSKGAVHVYFSSGATLGQDPHSKVKITPKASSTDVKVATCWTIFGEDEIVVQTNLRTTNAKEANTSPSNAVSLRTGTRNLVFGGILAGVANQSEMPINGGVQDFTWDFGSQCAAWGHYVPKIKGTEHEDFLSWSLTTKNVAAVTLAVHEKRDLGLEDEGATALPGTAGIGDKISYLADKTNGVVWEFVFDGQGEYPWKKIGGPPMFNTTVGVSNFTNTAADGTGMPILTSPLAMEAEIGYGAAYCQSGNAGSCQINLFGYVGGVSKHLTPMIVDFQFCTIPFGEQAFRSVVAQGAQVLSARAVALGTYIGNVNTPFIKLDPIRAK